MLVPSQVGSRDTSRSTTVARKWHPFPPAIDRDQRHPRRTQLTRELRPTTAWSKTITHGQVFTCNHASCFCYPISSAATHPAEFSDTAFCIGIALLLRIGPVGLHFFHSTTTILQHQAFIQNGMPSPARAPVGSVQPPAQILWSFGRARVQSTSFAACLACRWLFTSSVAHNLTPCTCATGVQ